MNGTAPIAQLRKSSERGQFSLGWLDSLHSFSFGNYHDPQHMGWSDLRVINQDIVQPGSGFGRHGHADMEILTYVTSGTLEHRDSLGTAGQIRPGEIQRMTAGTGIEHSEMNPSDRAPVSFLQIWVLPGQRGLAPGYEQVRYAPSSPDQPLQLIASPQSGAGQVKVHQDMNLYRGVLEGGAHIPFAAAAGRQLWLQVVRGALDVAAGGADYSLTEGDGLGLVDPGPLTLRARSDTEFLLFDLRG